MIPLDPAGMTTESMQEMAWDDGSLCTECPHYHEWEEHHPYGSTTAAEHLCECRVDKAENCPWVDREVRRQAAECQNGNCGDD